MINRRDFIKCVASSIVAVSTADAARLLGATERAAPAIPAAEGWQLELYGSGEGLINDAAIVGVESAATAIKFLFGANSAVKIEAYGVKHNGVEIRRGALPGYSALTLASGDTLEIELELSE